MIAAEAVLFLERAWSKTLTDDQRKLYCRKLQRFSPEQLEKIYDRVVETCKYFPKIADLYEAAGDCFDIHQGKGRNPDRDCSECAGKGWVTAESVHADTGDKYPSVRRCSCSGLAHPKPSGRGPGGYLFKQDGS